MVYLRDPSSHPKRTTLLLTGELGELGWCDTQVGWYDAHTCSPLLTVAHPSIITITQSLTRCSTITPGAQIGSLLCAILKYEVRSIQEVCRLKTILYCLCSPCRTDRWQQKVMMKETVFVKRHQLLTLKPLRTSFNTVKFVRSHPVTCPSSGAPA
jgi:hypothetical protein